MYVNILEITILIFDSFACKQHSTFNIFSIVKCIYDLLNWWHSFTLRFSNHVLLCPSTNVVNMFMINMKYIHTLHTYTETRGPNERRTETKREKYEQFCVISFISLWTWHTKINPYLFLHKVLRELSCGESECECACSTFGKLSSTMHVRSLLHSNAIVFDSFWVWLVIQYWFIHLFYLAFLWTN